MKHMNQPVMNGPPKMRLNILKEDMIVVKEELIIMKEMENKEILRKTQK